MFGATREIIPLPEVAPSQTSTISISAWLVLTPVFIVPNLVVGEVPSHWSLKRAYPNKVVLNTVLPHYKSQVFIFCLWWGCHEVSIEKLVVAEPLSSLEVGFLMKIEQFLLNFNLVFRESFVLSRKFFCKFFISTKKFSLSFWIFMIIFT